MHLPTINHIDLSCILNFPLFSLTSSVNLHRLDLSYMYYMKPKIREFHISDSSALTTKLLHAKRQDGRPAFNFMDLRRLSTFFTHPNDEQNLRYLLQLLEELYLSVAFYQSLVGLHDTLSPSARILKVLDLTASLYNRFDPLPLGWLCEELEAMAGHDMLEALSLEVQVHFHVPLVSSFVGSVIEEMVKVLVKPGWSALRQVSIKVSIKFCPESTTKMSEALQ